MKRPKVSIRTLMIIVGIASVNLAVGRTLYTHELDVLVGVFLSGLTLQFGVYRLIRGRGRSRAFWAGFVAAGLLATLSYAWATGYPRVSAVFVDRNTRRLTTYLSPGASFSDVWEGYSSLAIDGLESLPFGADIAKRSLGDPVAIGADALIPFAPQVVIAVAGGLLALLAAAAHRSLDAARTDGRGPSGSTAGIEQHHRNGHASGANSL
jgi:hypothetical protein